MDDNYQKIVNFEKCKGCIHFEKDENDDPCYDCLQATTNYASHTPLYFEPKPTKKGN